MRRRTRFFAAIAVVTGLAAPAGATCADPATCSCTISTSGLSFGTYDPGAGAPDDSVGTISARCASADPGSGTFSVALSAGEGADVTRRAMRSGTDRLAYNLYTDVARSIVWGEDGGGGISVVAAFPASSDATQTLNVYGRIPARQPVAPGTYADTIMITVSY